jgi:DNA-binding winged helix-turn-helix (wHTH) protein
VTEAQKLKELYEFGPFRVDPEKEMLLRAGEPVPLTPKTFQILLVLVRHSQEIVTKDDLLKTVWPDTFVEEGNLSRSIFMLRKALGESPQDHKYIY